MTTRTPEITHAVDVHGDLTGTLAAVLADVVGAGEVAADSNFFDDLGADSMVMARFCARVRKRVDLPSFSMRDVYDHPSIAALAGSVEGPLAAATPPAPILTEAGRPGSTAAYVRCGALQLLIFLAYTFATAAATAAAYDWINDATGVLPLYLRAVATGAAAFAGLTVLPIAAKWVLIGRWKAEEIPLWGLRHVRFWLVKTLVRTNPVLLLAIGSPLYPLYLRALGARIGPRVTILTRAVPICTDLLTIGADTVIRKDAALSGYRARAGHIEIGSVRIGSDAFVGEAAVLDIDTAIGDGAELGHASSLHAGQSVPDGATWHGVPGQPSSATYRMRETAPCGPARRVTFCVGQLLMLVGVYLPAGIAGTDGLILLFPQLRELAAAVTAPLGLVGTVVEALVVAALMLVGLLVGGLLVVAVVPRLLAPLVPPGRVLPLYSFRWSAHRMIGRLTNVKFFFYLFGDSSYVVGYLSWIGYRMREVAQTGSNFGTGLKHESPFLTTVGSGTMVADGLSVANAEVSSTAFRVSPVTLGARSFLGNRIVYPVNARVGENCLLATKVLLPVDGPVREGVGLLGSPAFEIPRSVDRDARYDHVTDGIELHWQLDAKDRYNRASMGLALLVRWMHLFGVILISITVAAEYARFGALALATGVVADVVFTTLYFVLVERLALGFRPLRPRFCSIYDPAFWRHERFWKLVIPEWERTLGGTPFKNLVSRALGVRLGRRVFDDGCFLPERTLVTIGDDAVLNAGTVVQCHSQEDGTFKSDRSRLGDRVTLGVGAFVHYGTSVGDDAELRPDSFLMKGEEVPSRQVWTGNPAHEVRGPERGRTCP